MTVSLRLASSLMPAWLEQVHLLRRGAAALSGLAVLVNLVVLVSDQKPASAYLGLVVSAAAVGLTLRHPTVALIVAVGGCCTAVAVGSDPTVSWTIAVFTLFSAALADVAPFRAGLFVAATLYLLVGLSDHQGGFTSAAALALVTAAAAAAGIGGGLRAQGRYWRMVEQRASEAATQAVSAERLRIARDLHDLIGHEVAALNMHIGVAEVNLATRPTQTAAALHDARQAVQSVLHETQQILKLLRQDSANHDLDDPGQPTPGPAQLTDLINSFCRLGLQIDAELHQQDLPISDPAVGLTLYRVVQESLTNAHRHGDGTAQLAITRTEDLMTVTVTNQRNLQPPHDRSRSRSGYGLLGMRERLTAIGGDLQLSGDEATFRVTATLPLTARSRR